MNSAAQLEFSKFVSSYPCSESIFDRQGASRSASNLENPAHSVVFDRLSYGRAHGIETLAIGYQTTGSSRLVFNNNPGLQLHLRRKGTGIYSFGHAGLVAGAGTEMQVFCSHRAWTKTIYERPGSIAQSLLFALPEEMAYHFLGAPAEKIYKGAGDAVFHARLPIRMDLVGAVDEIFSDREDPISGLVREGRLLETLGESLRTLKTDLNDRLRTRIVHPRDVERITWLRRRIDSQSNKNFGVSDLALEVGMSPSKFKIVFRAVTGYSVGAYVRERRMIRAAELLAANYSVSEAAYAVGYSHLGHFAKAFRARFNQSPSFYRVNDGGAL